jgi:hypothetical protein
MLGPMAHLSHNERGNAHPVGLPLKMGCVVGPAPFDPACEGVQAAEDHEREEGQPYGQDQLRRCHRNAHGGSH